MLGRVVRWGRERVGRGLDELRLRRHPYQDARILLVGDTIVHRLRLSALLRGGGFALSVVAPPRGDLDPVRRFLPSTGLLLVNLCSAGFEGRAVVRRLHEEGITARVLTWAFDSALDGTPERREELCALGVRGFLDHSETPEEILNRLNALYYSAINTRRVARRLLYVTATFRGEGGNPGVGYVTSLSADGLFLQTMEPGRIGSREEVRFRLPDSAGAIRLVGEVIHHGTYIHSELPAPNEGMGLRFVEIDSETRERIRRFTEQRETEEVSGRSPEGVVS